MKKCYQLFIICDDGSKHDLIFGSLKKAEKYLKSSYKIGLPYYNSVITRSFIVKRILF